MIKKQIKLKFFSSWLMVICLIPVPRSFKNNNRDTAYGAFVTGKIKGRKAVLY